MSYTYHGTTNLIALPNRAVQTFPSGLVRVERSFVCRKSEVAKHRNSLLVNELMPQDDGTPAIDGLYIYPEPQEVVRDDGFVEFRVTAYGRQITLQELAIDRGSVKGTYIYIRRGFENQGGTLIPTSETFELPSINETYTLRSVLPSSSPIGSALVAPNISNPGVYPVNGSVLIPTQTYEQSYENVDGSMYRSFNRVQVGIVLDAFSSVSFGQWSEFTVTWRAAAEVSTGTERA